MWNDLPLILAQEPPPEVAPEISPPPNVGEQSVGDDLGQTQVPSDGSSTPDNTTAKKDPGGFPWPFILLAMVLLWIVLMGGGRKEKKRRAAMLATMGKGDKIQTIGGVLGTVLEIKDDEVVVKVDENANVRLRFAKTAIQSVVTPSDRDD